jgi:hypothetical protein
LNNVDRDNDDFWEDVPPGEEDPEELAAEEAEEAKLLSRRAASLMGREQDPPDSGWLQMDADASESDKKKKRKKEKEKGAGGESMGGRERVPMGKLCVSVEVLHKDASLRSPAGQGRRAPNQNPYLPPPVGRLKWSWNPFVMGAQLCGPKICCYITCLFVCTAFILMMIYCQPALNIFIWILTNVFIPG